MIGHLWDELAQRRHMCPGLVASVAGIDFEFACSSSRTMSALEEMLVQHLGAGQSGGHRHRILIAPVRRLEQTLGAAGYAWQGALADGTPVHVVRQGEVAEVLVGRQISILIDPVEACTVCRVAPYRYDEEPQGHAVSSPRGRLLVHRPGSPAPWSYLVPLLNALLSAHGTYVLHAAGACHNGKATLMLGPSGVGKTTSVITLANTNIIAMSDDLIAIRRENGVFRAYGIVISGNTRLGKDVRMQMSAPVGELLFLQRSADGLHRTEPLTKHDAMLLILEQSNDLSFLWRPKEWFDIAAGLSEAVPGRLWSLGRIEDIGTHFLQNASTERFA